MAGKFNGFDYETTLAYFKYTMRNPTEVRNGETRGAWFERCHGITGKEFAKVVREVESEPEFCRIMGIENRTNMGRRGES